MKNPHIPKYLNPGDEVRIVSPASCAEPGYIEQTRTALQQLGYNVSLGEYVLSEHFQFAGTDYQRTMDMQNAIDSESVKAVFCARGGYGSVRIIDKLNFDKFISAPKWIIGFSDITVFHAHLNQNLGIATIHSPMPVNANSKYFAENLNQLNELLSGRTEAISLAAHELNRFGSTEGILTGGNLSILYSLQATPYAPEVNNNILFIEDVGEQLYHLDRMMNNMRLSGKLQKLSGMILGQFTAMQDKKRPFGKSAYEIITDYTRDLNIPVYFGFQAGHTENNRPFMLGRKVELTVDTNGATLSYVN